MVRLLLVARLILAYSMFQLHSMPVHADEADVQLEAELVKRVNELADRLGSVGVRNIGVFKFVVLNDDKEIAPERRLNTRLAEKVELALVWSDAVAKNGMVVLKACTDVAQGARATHLDSQDVREKLFTDLVYPTAWRTPTGATMERADAFISGTVLKTKNLGEVKIQLNAVARKDFHTKLVGEARFIQGERFTTLMPVDDLIANGESYVVPTTRGLRAAPFRKQVIRSASKSRTKEAVHPLQSPDSPVELEILYDGKPQKVLYVGTAKNPADGGKEQLLSNSDDPGAYVAEPREGQNVHLVVRRKPGQGDRRFAILLRVNGENTLLRQRLPDHRCMFWVLGPNREELVLKGFQKKLGKEGGFHPFRVASQKESLNLKNFYGHHVGLISLTVFEEDPKPIVKMPREKAKLHAIKNMEMSKGPAESREKLQKDLTDLVLAQISDPNPPGRTRGRGLLLGNEGEVKPFVTEKTEFRRAPKPILAASVRYYPNKKK